jgi:chemotaxis protein MotB
MTRILGAVAAALLVLGAGCAGSSKSEKKDAAPVAQEPPVNPQAELVGSLERQLDDAQQQLSAMTQERDALQVQTASLTEAKGAAEQRSQQYEALSHSLQKEIQAGQVEVTELRNRMVVKLKDKILFPSGSAKLSREGRGALDAVAGAFKDLTQKNVVVAGYTDDVPVSAKGAFQDNWDLSSARAIAVVRYLASKGVPPEMLAAAGFSQFRPVAPNDSPANRSQNRRIEIALTPADYVPAEVEMK